MGIDENRDSLFTRDLSESFRYGRARTPHYEFLNRSPRREVENVRQIMESWYARFPVSEHKRLKKALKSQNRDEFHSAFYELYCHEILARCGYSISVHHTESSHQRVKDFTVSRNNVRFEFEATVCSDMKERQHAGPSAAQRALLDYVDEHSFVQGFRYQIDILRSDDNIPKSSRLSSEIKRWAQEFVRSEVRAILEANRIDELPKKVFQHQNWKIMVTLLPRPTDEMDYEGFQSSIGIGPIYGGCVQHDVALRNTLMAKAKRYSGSQLPFVIAVNTIFEFPANDEIDILNAHLGREIIVVTQNTSGTLSRNPDGLWIGQRGGRRCARNTKVSAVFLTNGLAPWSVGQTEPVVYLNPYARMPLPVDALPFQTVSWDTTSGEGREKGGVKSQEFFGLSTEWPYEVDNE